MRRTVLTTSFAALAALALALTACGDDGYRVTSVVVELPDGPQTFELELS